jgi:hypothetical protein
MIMQDDKLIVEAPEVAHLLRAMMGKYLYMNKNKTPATIQVNLPAVFEFRYDAASPIQTVPINYIGQVVAKKKSFGRPADSAKGKSDDPAD